MCFLLTHLTGVELVQGGVAEEEGSGPSPAPGGGGSEVNALCCGGVHRGQVGDYSLLHDGDGEADLPTLDALLYFSAQGRLPQCSDCYVLPPSAFCMLHPSLTILTSMRHPLWCSVGACRYISDHTHRLAARVWGVYFVHCQG